ncbi:MAG: type II secretion system protein GspC [Gammaproteobacteria bacterium]|nr:type II secretion system protein GspC [Gammaproteobacteria bacterium]MDH4254562.1 type II secretion system protein GspC [Gammaproteobacteria bacterium]MDH5310894.1 type II secretion system protein GspC [Gammaproteobacteria bacterium]
MAIQAKWADFSNLDRDRLIAILNGRLPPWVVFVLIALIAWQLARIVWMLVPGSGAGDTLTVAPPVGAGLGRSPASADVQTIVAAHLFGEASAADAVAVVPDEPLEELAETRLALTLKGTMAGTDNRLTVAIIADNRNEEKVYTINDAVAAGTTLHAVYADRVVLNRSGALEVLKLPKDFPKTTAPVIRQQTAVNRTATDDLGDETQSIQDLVSQNVTKLADIIRPTPYFEGGQQQGYRVYPGRDRKQFAALGLRPGDLIKDIDGQALTDPQQAMQIFQSLGEADQVSVTVERNGQPQVLVLTTSQISVEEPEQ